MTDNAKITLTELQKYIRDKLYEALPSFYWVIAEITELKINRSGHCYLELTDSERPGGKITAKARATIWASKYNTISAFFSATTGIPLREGIIILFRATVEYHELYGLSLNISDIDPLYTAGNMALKREAILRQLTEEGVINMNKELPLPMYPRNIAVISSGKAAGYQDFVQHLHGNKEGYVFSTTLFDAAMQGEATAQSVTEALDRIASSGTDFDMVVIIRGGGSTTDLSWFDNYNIAFYITQFPLPVLTGIGHDKDLTVTDIVAAKALKTPTAVADSLITMTQEAEEYVSELASAISSSSSAILSDNEERLSSLQNHLTGTARIIVRVRQEQLAYSADNLNKASGNALRNAGDDVKRFEKTLEHLNPANILRRGYTITLKDGYVVRSPGTLSHGDKIITMFEKGSIESIVKENNKP